MKIIRTVVWVVILIALLLFSLNNWDPVNVKIWEDLILETKLPALVLASFLVGILPMWLLHRGRIWRLNRRIASLENAARSAIGSLTPASAQPEALPKTLPEDTAAADKTEKSTDPENTNAAPAARSSEVQ